jgi:hypothetical protein
MRLSQHRDALQAAVAAVAACLASTAMSLLTCAQNQLDEATSSIHQLQAALSRTATGAAGVCSPRARDRTAPEARPYAHVALGSEQHAMPQLQSAQLMPGPGCRL